MLVNLGTLSCYIFKLKLSEVPVICPIRNKRPCNGDLICKIFSMYHHVAVLSFSKCLAVPNSPTSTITQKLRKNGGYTDQQCL